MGEQVLKPSAPDTSVSNTPTHKRLSDLDKAFALRYSAEGMTQVAIAKRLGVTQPSISQWLAKCQDTTAEAGLYFRGQALPMAQKVRKYGKPDVLLKALQGVGVIDAEARGGITIVVGGSAQVQVNIGTLSNVKPTPQDVVVDAGPR